MLVTCTPTLLGMAPPPGQSGQSTAPFWVQMVPFLVILVIFYLILILPQQKKAKEHAQLLKALKPGDKIVTSGGVIGVVISVKDKSLAIRSADAKLEVLKSSVSEVTERASGSNGS
ncbi:MAG: preprotein translocase subunit YajC [Verrucomicrobia bacterium]|nr:preprotein translocase subunit YajC [Verrucomicrobiota bacterium]